LKCSAGITGCKSTVYRVQDGLKRPIAPYNR